MNCFKELPGRASELKLCFYCSNSLPASNQEHIFNASLAGSHQTGQLICNECNQSFSERVDRAFLIYTSAIMNAWSFKGKRRKSIPTIELEGPYFLEAGAKLRLKEPLVEKETQTDGQIKFKISFNSRGEAKRWLKGDAESYLGRALSQEEQDEIIRQAKFRSEDAQPQKASANLNLQEQYRSATHTILKCLAFFIPDLVCHEQTKQVREFARYDRGDWQLFAVEAEQHFSLADQPVSLLGVHHNSVEIYWCSYLRMVIGVVTILNRVKRAVVIAKDYSGPDRILYVFEDTHGSGKPPRAILAEINSQEFSLPIIEIQDFASQTRIDQVFGNELSFLTNINYPRDALTAKLIKKIEEVNQVSVAVDEKIVEKYREAFLDFFTNLGKILGKSIDLDKVLSKMSDYEFETLTHRFAGRNCRDMEFNSSVVEIFKNLLNELE
ncbi:MAG: hypothetical protein JGK17_30155 [Microcoleus sp. PH2017_10_PVI_O_A]|uniref:HNH endonuclease n=2 Tax=Microcoleus TaxID=44471 RepID=UPI001D53C8F7|nr:MULTISPECIES: HNH endonuclease [unclassified Microcoleus]MCC3482334.1 hypothetical protein [Microcoleus sp. PH2017_12_PCY_D_A]TAE74392.1 MAG: hypothetical protein EAZ83_30475 [Oscillatoriales cyanobacterium]MCC3409738.1 hypothetical protein [Microcoleus sp. PH2017_10_PVI_O_A]MCC3464004.1 hypothetical protein [Microcoleus sp. PH2017_11_PCY_U_A]MCC3532193.1 hypothetical protein [Microcoleus sp. PH2017_21_RUC_O_A]